MERPVNRSDGKQSDRRKPRASYYSPQAGRLIDAPRRAQARFAIGDVVRHKLYDFRGVVFDIDPVFANSEEWYDSIPKEMQPNREQPYYHLLAENGENSYVAYVSQQNLTNDAEGGPVDHPSVDQLFEDFANGRYQLRHGLTH
jgi:heat shock protein HspQ